MGKIIYDFGDGSRNTTSHTYGDSASNPIYWVNPDGTQTPVYATGTPNASEWVDWRDSGNGWTNLLTALGNKLTSAVVAAAIGSSTGTTSINLTLDASKEYVFFATSNNDENEECNFGSIYVTVNGVAYTLQQCINNNYIKPLVLISRCLSDHTSKNNSLQVLLDGGNSATETYGTNLCWRFMFIINSGNTVSNIRFSHWNNEIGSYKLSDASVVGFPCLGSYEKTDYIYKGAGELKAIGLGLKEITRVMYRTYELWSGGALPLLAPRLIYDYETDSECDEVDFLYTTDTHLSWSGSGNSAYKSGSPQVFTLDNVAYYKDKLWNAGIPTFCLDCGDFIHGTGNQESVKDTIINFYNNCGSVGYNKYLAVTYGNHEWYSAVGTTSTIIEYFNRVDNMTACNLLVNGEPVYKPYRAIRIGSKKIGIIGVGYPSPNGRDGTTSDIKQFEGYTFYDGAQTTAINAGSALYTQVQRYIDLFKNNGFDYIIAISHMDKYADEDFTADSRFNARADSLIKNTNGLDVVIPGHYNYAINATYTFTDLGGKSGMVVQEAGSSLNSFGRLRFIFNNSQPIQSYLLDEISDLEVI